MLEDIRGHIDPAQFGNEPGVSLNHYLIQFVDKVLSTLDHPASNENLAVIASMTDYKQAFSRKCPTRGIKSFIKKSVENDPVRTPPQCGIFHTFSFDGFPKHEVAM